MSDRQTRGIETYDAYIKESQIGYGEYTQSDVTTLQPIQGITYEGLIYEEACSGNRKSFVTMPYMSTDELVVNDRVISSDTTASRLCTLIMVYHVFNRDCTIPVVAYMIAKTLIMKPDYEFLLDSLLPSDDIKKLSSRISNEDGKFIDIIKSSKSIFMKAINSNAIPWLQCQQGNWLKKQ